MLDERAATARTIGALVYTRRMIKETMRLYPPMSGFFREVTSDYGRRRDDDPRRRVMVISQ